ncbi:MAG: putative toxin-antitoxin system toxin component, PIN family [Deltaproteobacteria bacterium]|nr:MAG: putative toxin-antitoxin system toxin component, PIN family [Deltaproteobacteria bacterium]
MGPRSVVRVVLDTNTVVSALLFSGISSKLVSLWQKGLITPLLSREILDEYLRVLSYPKFDLSEGEIKELIQEEILPYAEVVKPKRRLRVVQRDPSDNKFVECAVAGKARVIISGDKELLSLGRYRQIRIQSPAQFLADNPELPDS